MSRSTAARMPPLFFRICALAACLLCSSTLFAASQDAKKLADCLKGWDIQWRLPYFPRYSFVRCSAQAAAPDAASATFSGAANRHQSLEFDYQWSWFPSPADKRNDPDALSLMRETPAQLTLQHFDRLLVGQQFRRVGDVRESHGARFATYEKPLAGGALRVDVKASLHRFEMVLNQTGTIRPDLAMPALPNDFDITEQGVSARFFALPGSKLIEEEVRFEAIVAALPPGHPKREGESQQVWAPVRVFTFELDRKAPAAEVNATYHALLTKAGWQATHDRHLPWKKLYRFTLGSRDIDLILFTGPEDALAVARASVMVLDSSLWPQVLPLLPGEFGLRSWAIAPAFDASGRASAATRREIFVLTARSTRLSKGETIGVVPVVSAELAGDSAAQRKARAAAKWLADELVKRRYEAARVRLFDEIKTPTPQSSSVKVGARMTTIQCGTVNDSRPGSSTDRCECRADFGVVSSEPGACK